MAFRVTITPTAEKHFRSLSARDRRILHAEISVRLQNQPTTETRALKKLRPNPFAQFELRVRDYRVLYNVEGKEVVILVIGRKAGNKLIVAGEEFHEQETDSSEPVENEPSEDTD